MWLGGDKFWSFPSEFRITVYVLDEEGMIRYVDKRGIDLIGTVDRMLDEMSQRDS